MQKRFMFDRWARKSRRNREAAKTRKSEVYRKGDEARNIVESVMQAARSGRSLSPRRCSELGVVSLAHFFLKYRRKFRGLFRRYGVSRIRDLLPHYGKERGQWQFHHKRPIRAFVHRCTTAIRLFLWNWRNLEPVTTDEHAIRERIERQRKKIDPKQREFFEEEEEES